MYKSLLYLFLFSYTMLVFRPFMPALADFTAHTFWYSKHMATVHCVNGRYHLHYEFAAAAKRNAADNHKGLLKYEESNLYDLTTAEDHAPLVSVDPGMKFFTTHTGLQSVFIRGEFPPPRA